MSIIIPVVYLNIVHFEKEVINMKLSDAPVAAVLPVTDLDRAKKFYIQTLGLKEMEVKKHEGEEVMLEAGKGTGLLLYKRPPVKVEHTQAGFMVDDLESTMTELK
jgi:predicted enzyme related to lactoylglutathione lyase